MWIRHGDGSLRACGRRIMLSPSIVSAKSWILGIIHEVAAPGNSALFEICDGNRSRVSGYRSRYQPHRRRTHQRQARVGLEGDHVRDHVTLGYAATVHSAQGVIRRHRYALLGEGSTRAMLYVAMTRGRDTNEAFHYQRITLESDHEHLDPVSGAEVHRPRRPQQVLCRPLFRTIVANEDRRAPCNTEADRTAPPVDVAAAGALGSLYAVGSPCVRRRRHARAAAVCSGDTASVRCGVGLGGLGDRRRLRSPPAKELPRMQVAACNYDRCPATRNPIVIAGRNQRPIQDQSLHRLNFGLPGRKTPDRRPLKSASEASARVPSRS